MITLVIVLIVLGFCLYLVETFIPMSPPVIVVIRAVVVLFSILYILSAFGIINLPVNLR